MTERLVYSRNTALDYLGKSDPPGHAEITTFTTDGTNLNLFARYATPPEEDETFEYHQYPIKSINLVDSHQRLKDGRRGLRNEQDYAKKQSYALRDRLQEHWRQHRDSLHPIAKGAPPPSVLDGNFEATDAYEDKIGHGMLEEQPCSPTPAASHRHKVSSSSLHSNSLYHPLITVLPTALVGN
jgi:hypothetical protein